MRRRVDEVGDVVLVLQPAPRPRPAAAALGAERVGGDGLDVALRRHHDDELFVVDEVLDVEVAVVVLDRRCGGGSRTRRGSRVISSLMTWRSMASSAEDGLELGDGLAELRHLLLEVGPGRAG